MTFVVSLTNRDTIQMCTLFIHINLDMDYSVVSCDIIFFGVEHIFLLNFKTLLCHLSSRITFLYFAF